MSKKKSSDTKTEKLIDCLLLDIPISVGGGALMFLMNGIGWGIITAIFTFALITIWRSTRIQK